MLRRHTLSILFACSAAACGNAPWVGPTPFEAVAFATGGAASGSGGTAAGANGVGGSSGGDSNGCRPGQSVLPGDVVNARDLGGTPILAGQSLSCGQFFRGAPLANLREQACVDFAALGVRTVIDLRQPSEIDLKPDAACIDRTARRVSAPLPIPYNVSPQDYVADVNATASIAEAFHVFGDDAAYPVYFHCTWGRDRTGIVAALILQTLGATRDAILNEYLLSAPTVGAYPTSLGAALDEVERRGGIEAYLTAAGISSDEIATLRARALLDVGQ